ncbi:MAG: DUF3854 domain-containing protein [Candidatus Omnitrophica bacterium]|nr:DUF3854 domain-containing protein [Candidatus Omnitrophota bacterium]
MFKPKHLNKEWPKHVKEVLLPQHLADLRRSKLLDEMILAVRIYSASAEESKTLLNRQQGVGGGYVIPYIGKDGFLEKDLNFKLDIPLPEDVAGKKSRKYIRPIGVKSRLYIPPKVWPIIDDVNVPIFLTEGEKKALKACQEGFFAIAISGVWNWSSGHEPVEDFDNIALKGRVVQIVFDSDKFTNKNVFLAERCLAEMLIGKGAIVKIINLPEK